MPSKGIYISLPAEILQEIDEACGGPSLPKHKSRSGRAGGRAAWVRRLIYRELGRREPRDIHAERQRKFQEQVEKQAETEKAWDWDSWVETVKRLRALREEGLSLRQVAKVLEKEKRPTKRGGKWSAQTVRSILLKTSKEHS